MKNPILKNFLLISFFSCVLTMFDVCVWVLIKTLVEYTELIKKAIELAIAIPSTPKLKTIPRK